MNITIASSKQDLASKAASLGSKLINQSLSLKGEANIILATGASQLEMLKFLVAEEVDWSRVNGFHLDEYINLPREHPASFRNYLKQRFVDKVNPANFYYIDGESDVDNECHRLGVIINNHPIDVAFVGIGENAHLAFNDPPADFQSLKPFLEVELDQACRMQQLGEGWFNSIDEVPNRAITMSIGQIMKSNHIICTVPDARKASAVANSLNGNINPQVPASILQQHQSTYFFLDPESAAQLPPSL